MLKKTKCSLFNLVLFLFRVVNVQAKEKIKPRPVALNTVELMRVASAGLGMGPHHAMQVNNRLHTALFCLNIS